MADLRHQGGGQARLRRWRSGRRPARPTPSRRPAGLRIDRSRPRRGTWWLDIAATGGGAQQGSESRGARARRRRPTRRATRTRLTAGSATAEPWPYKATRPERMVISRWMKRVQRLVTPKRPALYEPTERCRPISISALLADRCSSRPCCPWCGGSRGRFWPSPRGLAAAVAAYYSPPLRDALPRPPTSQKDQIIGKIVAVAMHLLRDAHRRLDPDGASCRMRSSTARSARSTGRFGFVFGAVRGFLLGVDRLHVLHLARAQVNKQPEWITNAKLAADAAGWSATISWPSSRPIAENAILKRLKKRQDGSPERRRTGRRHRHEAGLADGPAAARQAFRRDAGSPSPRRRGLLRGQAAARLAPGQDAEPQPPEAQLEYLIFRFETPTGSEPAGLP